MIRLMIADDHAPTREQAVQELQVDGVIKVIAQAETFDETLKTAQQLLPDILLLDLHMPGLTNVYELLKRVSSLRNVKVIMYAGEANAAEVQDLLDAGAYAYVLKTDPPALVRMTMLMVSRGSRGVISPSLPRHLTRLSPQERSVLRHITKRGRLPQIAERMGISEDALRELLEHLSKKLELNSTAQLVKWAKKHGF
jgi:two-component system, NarL family, nitrate/nitrite response regulator NarL